MPGTLISKRASTLLLGSRTLFTAAVLIVLSSFAKDTADLASDHSASARFVSAPALAIAALDPAVIPFLKPHPAAVAAPVKRTHTVHLLTGLASWYGAVLQDHRTASGQIFDMKELTAAHNNLPFGSKVRVTNLRNRRSVIVTITDRGILSANRIIDLSYAAAEQLNMIKSGVDTVRIEILTRQQVDLLAEAAAPPTSAFLSPD